LSLYPAATDAQALRSAEDLAGDDFIAFSTWKWLNSQVKTGQAPVYAYLFEQVPAEYPSGDERRFSRGGSWSTPLRRDRIRVPDAEVVGPAVDAGGFSSGGYHVIVLGKLRAKRRS